MQKMSSQSKAGTGAFTMPSRNIWRSFYHCIVWAGQPSSKDPAFLFSLGQSEQRRDGRSYPSRLPWCPARRHIAKISGSGIPRFANPHPSKKVFQKLALGTPGQLKEFRPHFVGIVFSSTAPQPLRQWACVSSPALLTVDAGSIRLGHRPATLKAAQPTRFRFGHFTHLLPCYHVAVGFCK
jgi:hypothetical protein